ncbi:hypothetical protein N9391_01050 [Gammaproteobacteria bacterium]|nr:hypothetical protein [Gammaproteobacteria bacterium]
MTDLTKIEKPFAFCTKEEQEGLNALIGIEGALQGLDPMSGEWKIRGLAIDLFKGKAYRQNPKWKQPKLDVPDWLWKYTDYNSVVIDPNGAVCAYAYPPFIFDGDWNHVVGETLYRLDQIFTHHNFNPLNIPWDQSLTKRPEKFTNDS